MTLADSVRKAIWEVDSRQPVFRVVTMEESAADTLVIRRVSAIIFVFFSAVALFLTVIGIYGVVSYLVAQQTREIGIRIALGAQASTVIRMVLAYSLRVALVGLAVGLPVAFLTARLLSTLLYQVRTSDPTVFFSVPLLLCVVALFASWIPALRASRVQPLEALRAE
jgi:ABC-type antimicrobial peptide transport system permease subunit